VEWPKKIARRGESARSEGGARRGDELGLERQISSVCRHFNLNAEYIQDELYWHRWIAYLATALDLDEQDDYKAYILAGGEPKKFKWASSDHAGTTPDQDIGQEMLRGLGGKKTVARAKGDIWQYGDAVGLRKVVKADKWAEQEDGSYKMVGQVWVDEDGKEVSLDGFAVVESSSEDAKAFAQSVSEKLH